MAARYKPGRPPVLRLPDQVTPAAASALPPAGTPASSETPSPRRLCFLVCRGESGLCQPFPGVLCADCSPCPTQSLLEPQTADPRPQSRAMCPARQPGALGAPGGGEVRRGFSSLEGRASYAKPAHDWRRVPALGRRGLQHPGPGEGQGEADPSATMGPSSQRRPYCCRSHASPGEVAGPAGPARPPGAGH